MKSSLGRNLNFSRFEEIDLLLRNEQLYLDPMFSLAVLSERINLSIGYLSQLINKVAGINFSKYINSLRIDRVKEMLTDSNFNKYTVLAIGFESGFNSKSAFYKAFKQFENCTPGQYKKSINKS